jgi:hypothetical protein
LRQSGIVYLTDPLYELRIVRVFSVAWLAAVFFFLYVWQGFPLGLRGFS